jgi:hypothetical protein
VIAFNPSVSLARALTLAVTLIDPFAVTCANVVVEKPRRTNAVATPLQTAFFM